jgi:hypothetical protein
VTLAPAPAAVCATGHRPEVIFDTGPASEEPAERVGGAQQDGVRVVVDAAALAQRPKATPVAGPSRGPRAGSGSPPVDREPDAGRLEGGQVAGGSSTCRYTTPLALVRVGPEQLIGGRPRPAGMLGRNSVTPSVSPNDQGSGCILVADRAAADGGAPLASLLGQAVASWNPQRGQDAPQMPPSRCRADLTPRAHRARARGWPPPLG